LDKQGTFDARSYCSAWNYFHVNSIDKDDQGNYLVSARHYKAIFKINGTDGSIIWQLGGTHGSDFDIPSNLEFAFQHDARFQYRSPDGVIERITFFDNAAYSTPGREIASSSRGRYVELNHTAGTVRDIHTYDAPDNLIAHTQGSFRALPNGNKLANWGSAGALTEFSDDGVFLFHAYLDSYPNKNVESYRGFKANWTGFPSEEPAVLALHVGDGDAAIFVSWNGDTETKFWKFYLLSGESQGVTLSLGHQPRYGFETCFETHLDLLMGQSGNLSIVAEALDSKYKVLGKSRPVSLTDDAPYRKILDGLKVNGDIHAVTSSRRLEL
jgi:hypothetical protein